MSSMRRTPSGAGGADGADDFGGMGGGAGDFAIADDPEGIFGMAQI